MRLKVRFRTLCLVGVCMVAVLPAGEALARGGGRSGGGHWIGGRGPAPGHHWGGGGVYYDDVGNYGDYRPDGPPAYGGATILAPNYSPASGYRAPPVVYPPVVYPDCAPVASPGSDPHIINVHAARRRGARTSCNCRAER
jgi:hypothetical protein